MRDEDDFDDAGEPTADGEATVQCPHCGEENVIAIDPGGGASQRYVEDCQVCCRPWSLHVTFDRDGAATVDVEALEGE